MFKSGLFFFGKRELVTTLIITKKQQQKNTYVNVSLCRIQPSPSLSLVVEVQAATDLDVHSQEVFKLASCGWTRMELFDQCNQVCKHM